MTTGKWTEKDLDKLKALHKEGKSYEEIGKALKRNKGSIASKLHAMKWTNGPTKKKTTKKKTAKKTTKKKGGKRKSAGRPRVTAKTRQVQARKVGQRWATIKQAQVRNMEAVNLADAIEQVQETHQILKSIDPKLARMFEKSIFAKCL